MFSEFCAVNKARNQKRGTKNPGTVQNGQISKSSVLAPETILGVGWRTVWRPKAGIPALLWGLRAAGLPAPSCGFSASTGAASRGGGGGGGLAPGLSESD